MLLYMRIKIEKPSFFFYGLISKQTLIFVVNKEKEKKSLDGRFWEIKGHEQACFMTAFTSESIMYIILCKTGHKYLLMGVSQEALLGIESRTWPCSISNGHRRPHSKWTAQCVWIMTTISKDHPLRLSLIALFVSTWTKVNLRDLFVWQRRRMLMNIDI